MSVTAADLTVAVATCGRAPALQRCLTALAEGDVVPQVVIVVDQAATPASRDAARAVEGLRVVHVERPRRGLSASRNHALHATTTRLLAVTDDDCIPGPGWVRALLAAFAAPPWPAAVTGPIVPDGPRPPGGHAVSLRESTTPLDHTGRVLPWGVGSGANFAGATELLRAAGGWDERLGTGTAGRAAEDSELLDRLLRGGGTVRYAPAAVVAHEWQTWTRRLETRWTYGYGIGALCGLRLRERDGFALRMLAGYGRRPARELLRAVAARDRAAATEQARALGAVGPGLLYGLRAPRAGAPAGAP